MHILTDFGRKQAVGLEHDADAPGENAERWTNKDQSVTELIVSVKTDDCQNNDESPEKLLVVETNSGSRRFPKQDIRQLALSVHNHLRQLIDEAVREDGTSDMVCEILHHWTVAKSLCRNFVGHQDTLQLIREYILGETVQPLVLTGESGTGKSTLMAQAAISATQLLGNGDKRIQSTVMTRFCGHTYDSQRSPRLISSLAEQFLCASNREPTGVSPWRQETKRILGDVMRNGDYGGLLVVFVDGIDELAPAGELDEFLDWLPARIANNVKVIVSCESEGRTLERLRQKVTNQANIVKLDQLSVDQSILLLNSLLDRSERRLTAEQWTLVEPLIADCRLPMYVHLLHDTVFRWTSFVDLPNQVLECTVALCAAFKFKNLEESLGISLTSNALGLLVAEPNGLSDCEMEDILSLNDDVLKEISGAGDIPSITRCPSITWIRVRDELGCYLAVGNAGGLGVVRFAHRALTRVAETRYAKSPSLKTGLHSQIADYFLGSPGPGLHDTMTRERQKRLERNIPDSPLYFNRSSERSVPNYRKLDLMPVHLRRSGRFRELYELVYFHFDWIYAKLVARSTQELLTDFRMVKDSEASMVAEAIALSEHTLTREPRLLGVELSGRLLAYYSTHDRIRSLIDQCDMSAKTLCPLVPVRTTFAAAGATLQKVVSISGASSLTGFSVSENTGRLLLSQKADSDVRMRVWNILSGERLADIVLTSGSEVFLSPDGKFGSVFKENTLRIYHLESGDLYAEIECGQGSVSCTASLGKYLAFGFDQAPGPTVVDLENGFLLRRLPYRSRSLAISHDLTYFACNSGETLAIHTFPLLERRAKIVLSAVAEKLIFSKERGTVKVYAMLGDRSLQAVSFQILKGTGNTQTLFQDFDLKDFKLSHNHDNLRILVCLSRSLYVLAVSTKQPPTPLRLQLNNFSLDTFRDAEFSKDDRVVMAIRGCHLCLWDASSALLIRELAFSDAPIVHLQTLETMNAALTIGSDFIACLWNLDRLTTEQVDRRDRLVVRGQVRHIAAAIAADRFICAGTRDCVLAVGSLNAEKWEHFGEMSNDFGIGGTLEYVGISPAGNYAVIRMARTGLVDVAGSNSGTPGNSMGNEVVETEDVLWDLSDCCSRPIYRVRNSVNAVFSSDESKVTFTVCPGVVITDGKSSAGEVVLFDLETWKRAPNSDNLLVHLPAEKAIAKTVFTADCSFLAYVRHSSYGNRNCHQLCVYSFEKHWPGLRYVNGTELLLDNHCSRNINNDTHRGVDKTENVVLVDVRAVKDAILLITIEAESFTQQTLDKPLQDTHDARRRLAVLYDVHKDSVLNRIKPFLLPFSDVEATIMLQHGRTFVDNKCNVFNVDSSTCGHQRTIHVGQLGLDIPSYGDLCFVLDGRYAVAIVSEGAELVLVRTEDGQERGRLETHCRATITAVCSDGRTVLVGCEDGGILAFMVIIEEGDPVATLRRRGHPSHRRDNLI